MLDFPRWKLVNIFAFCLLFILLAIPNILPEKIRENLPAFLPSRTVNLGLDLQGGSYLLLELQFDRYIHEELASDVDTLRSEMIAKKIAYQGLNVVGDKIVFTLLKPSNEIDSILEKFASKFVFSRTTNISKANAQNGSVSHFSVKKDYGVDVNKETDNSYEIGFSEKAINEMKIRLLEQSMQIVNKRVNETGTREPIIQRQGDNRIILQVPGLQDPERLKSLLGKTAKMTFHLVDETASMTDLISGKTPLGSKILYEEEAKEGKTLKMPIAIKTRVMLTGERLVDASVGNDDRTDEAIVKFRFDTQGAQRFAEITQDNLGKKFAIVLDDKVITAPVIRSAILGGTGQISGSFTVESANDLAVLLRSGALPVPLKVIEERSVGPSLGADSIAAGKKASILGIILVMGFMLINYGLFGIFANVALFFNLIFITGALSLFQATLTLPGIAGMVLTLGMAVDANVLIYERIREEIRNGKTPFSAIENGFRAARNTIMDANVTTLIAALTLFYFGTGTVKGFAVTLAIGIIASMFTAIVLTRLMVATWLRKNKPKVIPI